MKQLIVFSCIILCSVYSLITVQGYTSEKNGTSTVSNTTNNITTSPVKSLMPFPEIKQGLMRILSNITDLQIRNEAASKKIRNKLVELTATTPVETTTTESDLSVQLSHSTNNNETTTQLDHGEVVSTISSLDGTNATYNNKQLFDYQELYVFNSWVTLNLDYAQQNTNNTMISLEDESNFGSKKGFVRFSNDTLTDGFEGVRYWTSAVIFQEKALEGKDFRMEQFHLESNQS